MPHFFLRENGYHHRASERTLGLVPVSHDAKQAFENIKSRKLEGECVGTCKGAKDEQDLTL